MSNTMTLEASKAKIDLFLEADRMWQAAFHAHCMDATPATRAALVEATRIKYDAQYR